MTYKFSIKYLLIGILFANIGQAMTEPETTMSLSDAAKLWEKAPFISTSESAINGLRALVKFANPKVQKSSKNAREMMASNINILDFFSIAQYVLDDEFAKIKAQGSTRELFQKNILPKMALYQALAPLTEAAVAIQHKIGAVPQFRSGGLSIYNPSARKGEITFRLGFIKVDGVLRHMLWTYKSGIYAMPSQHLTKNLSQLEAISLNDRPVTDYGFFVENRSNIPIISVYSGQFGAYPYSRSQYAACILTEDFDSFSTKYKALIAKDGRFAFISLFSNEAEKIGFGAEFTDWLAEETKSDFPLLGAPKPMLLIESAPISEKESAVVEESELEAEKRRLIELEWASLASKKAPSKKLPVKKKKKKPAPKKKAGPQAIFADEGFDEKKLRGELAAQVEKSIGAGRVKFRKVAGIVSHLLKSQKINLNSSPIEAKQHGSHITLHRPGAKPVTLVKLHGKKNTLSINEAHKTFDDIINFIVESQRKDR